MRKCASKMAYIDFLIFQVFRMQTMYSWIVPSNQKNLLLVILLLATSVIQLCQAAQPLPPSSATPTCTTQLSSYCKSSYSKGPVLSGGHCRIMQQCCRTAKDKCPFGTNLYYLGEIGTGNTPCYECL